MKDMKLCVPRGITVREAMRRLDELYPKLLILVDEANHLVGTLTDGDVRRFLLDGGKMDDAALLAANCTPITASSMEQAKQVYSREEYFVIPIINDCGKLVDLFMGSQRFQHAKERLNIPVIINAGGKGTRLDPYTRVLPKPLIPIGDMPIIEHIIRRFREYGCEKFHVIANYKKQLLKAYFSENEMQYDIDWHDEDKPLGTGGGLSLLRGKLNETFFFTNCDVLLSIDYAKLLAFHKENRNRITMVCAYKNLTIPYGVVKMGESGRIISMQEKPELSFLTNTGLYVVEPETLEDVESGVAIGFPDIVEAQRAKGYTVAAYPVSENDWLDMGQLKELERMKARLHEE